MRYSVALFALIVSALVSLVAVAGEAQQASTAAARSEMDAWLGTHLKHNGTLDLRNKCRSQADSCRTVDADLLSRLLRTVETSQTIVISGAIIKGGLDLRGIAFHRPMIFRDVEFDKEIMMGGSSFEKDVLFEHDRINGGLMASNADFGGQLVLSGTAISAVFDVRESTIRRGLSIIDSDVISSVNLDNATIFDELNIKSSLFMSDVHAYNIDVQGVLTINEKNEFKKLVTLQAADISRVAHISNSAFVEGFDAKWAHFKKSLLIDEKTTFGGSLKLEGAHIDDDIVINQTQFRSANCRDDKKASYSVNWERIEVKGSVFVTDGTTFQCVFDMIESTVEGNIEIGAPDEVNPVVFEKKFNISLSSVKNSIYIHDSEFRSQASIASTQVTRHLDVAGSKFNSLNLNRSSIGGDFRLWPQGTQTYNKTLSWEGCDTRIDLRYAHIDVIQDELNAGASQVQRWPQHVDVEGFTFDHFGTQRDADWAEWWLGKGASNTDKDKLFDPQPFEEMANYFKRVGSQDDSDQIRTKSRDLELMSYERQCSSQLGAGVCWHFARLAFLKIFVGYGIGYGLFWALLPTTLFVFLGWRALRFSEKARNKGHLWCVMASLNKLIPGINFSKEYSDAFDNPSNLELSKKQNLYFAVHTVVGVILASALFAALAGLTQAR